MIPDIVEIKRLCASSQWLARIENGKILLHDTVAGETVCIGQTDAEPVRRGRWFQHRLSVPKGRGQTYLVYGCSLCHKHEKKRTPHCPNCGAKMEGCDPHD